MKNEDIFNRLMSLYKRYEEQLLYIFFGVLTTAVNIAVFFVFTEWFGISVLISNVFAWVIAVFFAFITNRIWVFKSAKSGFIKQMISFFMGRIATLLIEELIIYVFINNLGFNSMAVKTAAQIIVILLNYIISKLFVFK